MKMEKASVFIELKEATFKFIKFNYIVKQFQKAGLNNVDSETNHLSHCFS